MGVVALAGVFLGRERGDVLYMHACLYGGVCPVGRWWTGPLPTDAYFEHHFNHLAIYARLPLQDPDGHPEHQLRG